MFYGSEDAEGPSSEIIDAEPRTLPSVIKWDGGGHTVFVSFDNGTTKIPMVKRYLEIFLVVTLFYFSLLVIICIYVVIVYKRGLQMIRHKKNYKINLKFFPVRTTFALWSTYQREITTSSFLSMDNGSAIRTERLERCLAFNSEFYLLLVIG